MAKFLNPADAVDTAPPNVLLELAPEDVQALIVLVWEKRQTINARALPRPAAFYDQLDRALTDANIYQARVRSAAYERSVAEQAVP